jgi:hypothetical protein
MEFTMIEKIELNKKLKNYTGANSFLLSLQKQLKSTKTNKVDFDGKMIKVLSDKQYSVAKELL